MIRKLLLTGIIVFFPSNPVLRSCMAVLICAVAISNLNLLRPHRNTTVFRSAQLGFLLVLFMYVCAIIFSTEMNDTSRNAVGAAIVFCIVLAIVGNMILILVLLRQAFFQSKELINMMGQSKIAPQAESMGSSSGVLALPADKGGRGRGTNQEPPKHSLSFSFVNNAVTHNKMVDLQETSSQHRETHANNTKKRKEAAAARTRARLERRRSSNNVQAKGKAE